MQEAQRIVEAIKVKVDRYNQAIVFLKSDMVLPSELHVMAVTRPIQAELVHSFKEEELVVAKDPPWGMHMLAPDWGPQVLVQELTYIGVIQHN